MKTHCDCCKVTVAETKKLTDPKTGAQSNACKGCYDPAPAELKGSADESKPKRNRGRK